MGSFFFKGKEVTSNLKSFYFLSFVVCNGKFDETYGCELWDSDFDLLKSDNELKAFVAQSLKNSIAQHEKRITTQDIEVTITEQDLGNLEKKRIKKKVLVSIKAIVLETNRPYTFKNSFFVSPLSFQTFEKYKKY